MFTKIDLFPDLGVPLTRKNSIVLGAVLVCTICFMWANYSLYYIRHLDLYSIIATIFILLTLGRSMHDINESNRIRPLFIVALIIYTLVPIVLHSEPPSIGVFFQLVIAYLVLSLKSEYKVWLYDRFVTVVALLFLFSSIEFMFAVFVGISHINTTPIYRFDSDAHYFYQGIITIFPSYYQTGLGRFQAFTEEPGLVGTLCAFLIACNDLKHHKWQSTVFVVSGILSMSLAFYLMFLVWLAYKAIRIKSIKNVLYLALILGVIYATYFDTINNIIGARINGTTSFEELDNRGTDAFNNKFDEFIHSPDIFFGRGLRTFHSTFDMDGDKYGGNAGAKPFIYSYGIVSFFLLFFYITSAFLKTNGRGIKILVLLLLFWLSFYQRETWFTPYNVIPLFMFGLYDSYAQRSNEQIFQSQN